MAPTEKRVVRQVTQWTPTRATGLQHKQQEVPFSVFNCVQTLFSWLGRLPAAQSTSFGGARLCTSTTKKKNRTSADRFPNILLVATKTGRMYRDE